MHVAIWPEAIALSVPPPAGPNGRLSGTIERVVYQGTGATYRLRADAGGPVLVVRVPLLGRGVTPAFDTGDRALATWDATAIHVMPA